MSVRVKICGITNLDDALAAIAAGADAVGFVFCEASPRHLSFAAAAQIVQALPPLVARVGVFVNPPEEFVREAIAQCGIDTVQLHGDEPPEFCQRFGSRVIKAVRVCDRASFERAAEYKDHTWLLDSFVPGRLGGTGERCDWDLARQARGLCRRLILAGGLTPANVAQAVLHVQPYAVDVSSGVESKPGRKDHQKMKDFVSRAIAAQCCGANP